MKLITLSIITLLLFSLQAQDTGLAPEVTDLNAADISYQKEKGLKYLETPYISKTPKNLNDGILVGTLGENGGKVDKVMAFVKEIIEKDDLKHKTDSMLISYKGKLIFESYYRRGRINYPHYQMSITKSYTAFALGRAIQLGYLKKQDLNKPVISFLKKIDHSKLVEGADKITIAAAMNMSSGVRLEKDKIKEIMKTPKKLKGQGQIQAYLENSTPIPENPKYKYQAADPAMVMQVLETVVPGSAKEFIRTEFLGKMGINNYGWQADLSGLPKSAAGSSFRSRDMLKMGMLIMNKGQWNGEQLLPADFVEAATMPIKNVYGPSHYGYFWWIDKIKLGEKEYLCKQGRGAGGQFIFMFQRLDLIVVVTAHNKGMGTMLKDVPLKLIPAFE